MTDWRPLCASARDLSTDGGAIVVALGRSRQHRVEVALQKDAIELRAIVARRAGCDRWARDAEFDAWRRNRAASLVGFRLDQRGRLLGESWVPTAGLTSAEFQLYVRTLAAACDLFEFQLTGADRE